MMMMASQQQQQQPQQPQQPQQRQLVIVVEATAALGPVWPLLVSEYVDKIVRAFCGINVPGQKLTGTPGEMALVVYSVRDSQNGCLSQQSGWTSNIDVFFRWLSSISFSGGGYGDAAVAEGLAEALQMCCPGPGLAPISQGRDCQKHCVLVGASNPCRIASPVLSPPVSNFVQSQSNNGDLQADQWWIADAETVAQAFPLCSVSLSVLAPRQLPQLRTIFTQGKRGGRTAETITEPPKLYGQHLVLISDSFMEARIAFFRSAQTNNMASNMISAKIEQQPVAVPVSTVTGQLGPAGGRPTSVVQTGIGVMPGRPGSSLPMQPVTVKTEAGTAGSLPSHLHNANSPLSLPMPQLSSAGTVPSQDAVQSPYTSMTSPDPPQDFKVLGNIPASQPLRQVGPNTLPTNTMLAHSPSQSRHTIGSPSLPPAGSPLSGLQPSGVGVPIAPIMSPGGHNSLSIAQGTLGATGQSSVNGIGQSPLVGQGVGMGTAHSNYNSGTTSLGTTSMMGPLQSASVNGGSSVNQGAISGPVNQGGLSSSNQMGQNGLALPGQNMIIPAVGNMGVNSGTGTLMSTTGVPQSPGQGQTHGVPNTAVTAPLHTAPATGTPPQQPPHNSQKYTRLWEGVLAGQRKGNANPIPICRLEGYRQISSSDTLSADWPTTMQIMRLIPQDYMNQNRDYHRKAELLIFRPLTQHDFLVQLAVKKLCAVIQLPTQTLLLASTDKPGRMIGMLFPGDMVNIVPQQQQTSSANTAPQSVVTSNFSQNQLQGQVQNQLPNNQLSGQLGNQQLRSQLLPGPTSLHGAGFLP